MWLLERNDWYAAFHDICDTSYCRLKHGQCRWLSAVWKPDHLQQTYSSAMATIPVHSSNKRTTLNTEILSSAKITIRIIRTLPRKWVHPPPPPPPPPPTQPNPYPPMEGSAPTHSHAGESKMVFVFILVVVFRLVEKSGIPEILTLSEIWNSRSRSITIQNNTDLIQAVLHLWSKFCDHILNERWVIVQTN